MRMALPCVNSTAGRPQSLHPPLLLTTSKTSNTIKVCSGSATLVQLSLVFFPFFSCSSYGVQSTGQKIHHHGMRMWPKGGGEEGWTSLEDRLDFGSPVSCTGILKEMLWTSHTRHPHLPLLSLCLLFNQ